jgi:hypothetical protein
MQFVLSHRMAAADEATHVTYRFGSQGLPDGITLSLDQGLATQDLELHPLNPSEFEVREFACRGFNDLQFDLDLARSWIEHCDRNHGSKCHSLPSDLVPLPAKLLMIDVNEYCLAEAPSNSRYVTLSYVWGQAATVRTTRDNVGALRQRGSLSPVADRYGLPATIKDTIELTRRLGLTYLWVDALCIVQDDEDSKKKFLTAMASIYAKSYLTVVAAEGVDASSGFLRMPGHGPWTEAEELAWPLVNLPGRSMMLTMGEAEVADLAKWNSRGWTFQEKAFARRMLIFNKAVTWFCPERSWCEYAVCEGEPMAAANPVQRRRYTTRRFMSSFAFDSKWPNLHSYLAAVNAFNDRDLTFSHDVADAFAGVLGHTSPQFQGGFHLGHPQIYFEASLLWKPPKWGLPLQRRVSGATNAKLPSWSWFGWKGPLDWGLTEAAAEIFHRAPDGFGGRSSHPCITIESISEWFIVSGSGSTSQKVKIEDILGAYRNSPTSYHSDGWSRHEVTKSNRFRQHAEGGYWLEDDHSLAPYWTHPKFRESFFRYPIPVTPGRPWDIDESHGAYLQLNTRSARLTISPPPAEISRANLCSSRVFCSLRDRQGRWAGILNLNDIAKKSIGQTPLGTTAYYRAAPEQIPTGIECELIAISRGRARNEVGWWAATYFSNTLEEWLFNERPKDAQYYEFYNVLWVERINGIAYRKALGRVVRDTWDKVASTPADMLLG